MILVSNTAKTWFHNADEVQGWCHASLVFSAPKKVVPRRRESLLSSTGERSARRRLASLLGQTQICSTSNIRSTSEERCVGFPGAGESCAPAPGKLFTSSGERSHSFSIEEKCLGKSVPAPGKLFPGAEERLAGQTAMLRLGDGAGA